MWVINRRNIFNKSSRQFKKVTQIAISIISMMAITNCTQLPCVDISCRGTASLALIANTSTNI
jgi:hypothetical protein